MYAPEVTTKPRPAVPEFEVDDYEPGLEGDIEALCVAAAEAAVVEAAEEIVAAAGRFVVRAGASAVV